MKCSKCNNEISIIPQTEFDPPEDHSHKCIECNEIFCEDCVVDCEVCDVDVCKEDWAEHNSLHYESFFAMTSTKKIGEHKELSGKRHILAVCYMCDEIIDYNTEYKAINVGIESRGENKKVMQDRSFCGADCFSRFVNSDSWIVQLKRDAITNLNNAICV